MRMVQGTRFLVHGDSHNNLELYWCAYLGKTINELFVFITHLVITIYMNF